MKRVLIVFLGILIGGLALAVISSTIGAYAAGGKPGDLNAEELAVAQAVQNAAIAHTESRALYAMYDVQAANIHIDPLAEWAYADLVLADPQTGEIPATEPGLAMLKKIDGVWRASLPGDPDWKTWLNSLPAGLMPADEVDYWNSILAITTCQLPTAVYPGFYLPWAYGDTATLVQAMHHDMYSFDTPTLSYPEHYAFDFVRAGGVAMFDVMASRAGTVVKWRDDVATNDNTSTNNVNYILIKDNTNGLYELYLHFAFASIPDKFKTVGAPVKRGEKIGVADNTGRSTGSHLHFQAEKKPFDWYNCSVDITFEDVAINGGRPRQKGSLPDDGFCYAYANDVCTTFQSNYVSGNNPGDGDMPTGDYTNITTGDVISQTSLTLHGWGADITNQFASAQVLAGADGAYQAVGAVATHTPFTLTLDVCALNLPNGPLDLGLRVGDTSGNVIDLKPLRTVLANVSCAPPEPACVPGAGQVALFADRNFSGGCKVFGVGGFLSANLGPVGVGAASSILVGSGARASLFTGSTFSGREEAIYASDANLGDNRIQDNSVVSLVVDGAGEKPLTPQPVWPAAKATLDGTQSHSLYWEGGWGDQEYQVRVITATGMITSGWSVLPGFSLADLNLKPGAYGWQVRSRSPFTESDWTAPLTFTTTLGVYTANTAKTLPFSDDVATNGGWLASGLWNATSMATPVQTRGTAPYRYWWSGTANPSGNNYEQKRASSLTSEPLTLPANPPAYLNFWYYYQTEHAAADLTFESPRYWDRRQVQVVLADGRVETLFRFDGDVMQAWKQSPYISLAKYAGKTIRLRFYFDTIDGLDGSAGTNNSGLGWFIDDIQVNTTAPAVCTPDAYEGLQGNNTPQTAYLLNQPMQVLLTARTCAVDLDYYRFSAKAGDHLVAATDTHTTPSPLDSVIELIDSDGTSVLAYNDDANGSVLESYLQTVLPHDGDYYIRVQSFSYPNTFKSTPADNGQSRTYDFYLAVDSGSPLVKDFAPADGTAYPHNPFQVSAYITPTASGLAKVEFFWHGSDWNTATWNSLGAGTMLKDVYSVQIDPNVIGTQSDAAFYVRATSNAGATTALGAFHVKTDTTQPLSSLGVITTVQSSNAFYLSWTGSDAHSGLETFRLDRKVDSSAWQPVVTQTLGTSHWEIVNPGHTYAYRFWALDKTGNISAPEIMTTTVPAAEVLCAASPDGFEPDNIPAAAPLLTPGIPMPRSFCNPLTPDFSADIDWVTATVQTGRLYAFQASLPAGAKPNTIPASPALSLYTPDGLTLIRASVPAGFSDSNILLWRADRDGVVALKVENKEPAALAGKYILSLTDLLKLYLMPILQRIGR